MQRLRVDMVLDVVCPWCALAFYRWQTALHVLEGEVTVDLIFHPFELNPTLDEEGEVLTAHLTRKYKSSEEDILANQSNIVELGKEIGFKFNFAPDMKMYNTRKAHELLLWSAKYDAQLKLMNTLFRSYFTDNKALNDNEALLQIVDDAGLDSLEAKAVLEDKTWAKAVSDMEVHWLEANIEAVPTIIIDQHYVISGAQPLEKILDSLRAIAAQKPTIQ
jgi:predicted DsbA family dithiol-disulfide isomerase